MKLRLANEFRARDHNALHICHHHHYPLPGTLKRSVFVFHNDSLEIFIRTKLTINIHHDTTYNKKLSNDMTYKITTPKRRRPDVAANLSQHSALAESKPDSTIP